MPRLPALLPVLFLLAAAAFLPRATPQPSIPALPAKRAYLGFDRNTYPGDAALAVLRRTFAFTGYWLGPPPGETVNTWQGKRELLRSAGFGFLVLYRGRTERELKNAADAQRIGAEDAQATSEAAKREGFPPDTIIFLDIEEGGRLSPAYHSYLQGWLWTLTQLGYQGGFYCSGIPVELGAKSTVTTADDITGFLFLKSRPFTIWAYNDACPPSPGCAFPESPPSPETSGISGAEIWQFAQSPRRKEFTAHCPPGYHKDGNCYAPGDTVHAWFLDVNSATSPDPSGARK